MNNSGNSTTPKKKRIYSAIQPSGEMTIGNYLGAIKNWVVMQDEFECIFSTANMHTITVRQDPKAFRQNTDQLYAMLLACGVDRSKCLFFHQSLVAAHAELAWVLNTYTQFGELSRMTQFKDKSARHADNVNAGLFTYPTLMAADILLYQADMVPIGADQKQHLELTRNVAERFNGIYGKTFTVPEPYIPKTGARVMSLADPTKKMSKSDENRKSFVLLTDEPGTIIKKFRSAVTDSEARVCRGENKAGINNLMDIYSAVTGKSDDEIIAEFDGRGYGDFKTAVGEAVVEMLAPIQARYREYISDRAYLDACAREDAGKAAAIAERTMQKVYKKIGMVRM